MTLSGTNGSSKENKLSKTQKFKDVPTKVVIRRLPPSLTADTFKEQVSPLPQFTYFHFEYADESLGSYAFGTAYFTFINMDDVYTFTEKFDGYVFVDEKGNEYTAIVEFAPFQKTPKSKLKVDSRQGSIEKDNDFLKFLECLENPPPPVSGPTVDSVLEEIEAKEKELKANSGVPKMTTPLLDYLKQRKEEKKAAKSRDERKRRDEERRKRLEEERKKKRERDRQRDEARRAAAASRREQAVKEQAKRKQTDKSSADKETESSADKGDRKTTEAVEQGGDGGVGSERVEGTNPAEEQEKRSHGTDRQTDKSRAERDNRQRGYKGRPGDREQEHRSEGSHWKETGYRDTGYRDKPGNTRDNRYRSGRDSYSENPRNHDRRQGEQSRNQDRRQGEQSRNQDRRQGDQSRNQDRKQGDQSRNQDRRQGDQSRNQDRRQGDSWNQDRRSGRDTYNESSRNQDRRQTDQSRNQEKKSSRDVQGETWNQEPYQESSRNQERRHGESSWNQDRRSGRDSGRDWRAETPRYQDRRSGRGDRGWYKGGAGGGSRREEVKNDKPTSDKQLTDRPSSEDAGAEKGEKSAESWSRSEQAEAERKEKQRLRYKDRPERAIYNPVQRAAERRKKLEAQKSGDLEAPTHDTAAAKPGDTET